jgi:hypothetical protein
MKGCCSCIHGAGSNLGPTVCVGQNLLSLDQGWCVDQTLKKGIHEAGRGDQNQEGDAKKKDEDDVHGTLPGQNKYVCELNPSQISE